MAEESTGDRGERPRSGRTAAIAVGLHALILLTPLISLPPLLHVVGRLGENDLGWRHGIHAEMLRLVFQVSYLFETHVWLMIPVSCMLLLADWQLCRRLLRDGRSHVVRWIAVMVATAALALSLMAVLPATAYLERIADFLDPRSSFWEDSQARYRIRYDRVRFAFEDLPLTEIIAHLNEESAEPVRIVLQAPSEWARTFRMTYTRSEFDEWVSLDVALEFLRTRIEGRTDMAVIWEARGDEIFLRCTDRAATPPESTEREPEW